MHPYVHCSVIYNPQDLEAPKCPSVDEWIKKFWCIYTMEYYSAIKQKEIFPFATAWRDLESIMLSEISQFETEMPYDFNYMCNLVKKIK